jgi:hypothetical protein
VLVSLDLDRRPALVRQSDLLAGKAAMSLPTVCKYLVAVMVADKGGQAAVVYAATTLYGPKLLLLDFDTGPMWAGLFGGIDQRVKDLASQCRARGAIAFVPADLARHAAAAGLGAEEIPKDLDPEVLLLK